MAGYRQRDAVDVFRYDSYSEVMRKIASPPINPSNRRTWEQDFNRPGAAMLDGVCNIGEECFNALRHEPITLKRVTDWLREGWPNGVKRIHEEMGKIELPGMTDVRRHARWVAQGDELNTDRLYNGDVDRMWRVYDRGTVRRPPPIHLFCDISVNCSEQHLFWRGATTFIFAEALIAAGHRVCIEQVVNIEGLSRSGSGFLAVIRIKDYDAGLNPSALAAVSANTASMRLTDFGHCTHIPETMTCYGGVASLDFKRITSRGIIDPRAHSLLVPNSIQSKTAAFDWIRKVCEDLETRVVTGEWEAETNGNSYGLVSPAMTEWEI